MRNQLTLACALATLALSIPAHAESWITTSRSANGAEGAIDFDSIEVVGETLKYRYRYGVNIGTAAARCRDQMRGEWTEQLFPVYPNTPLGDELKIACSTAKRIGLVPAEGIAPQGGNGVQQADARKRTTEQREQESIGGSRPRSTGSGFIIGPRLVVTNHHVIEGCASISVRREGETFSAKIRADTERSDLAALAVEGSVGTPLAIRGSAMLGEDVLVAGHPLAGILATDLIVTTGNVNSLAGLGNDPNLLQISAPVQAGNSGGPLIDRSGSLVGVVVSKLNVERFAKLTGESAQNVNFAIKPEILRLFLDSNRISYRSAAPGKRLEGFELAERARSFTVQVLCY